MEGTGYRSQSRSVEWVAVGAGAASVLVTEFERVKSEWHTAACCVVYELGAVDAAPRGFVGERAVTVNEVWVEKRNRIAEWGTREAVVRWRRNRTCRIRGRSTNRRACMLKRTGLEGRKVLAKQRAVVGDIGCQGAQRHA